MRKCVDQCEETELGGREAGCSQGSGESLVGFEQRRDVNSLNVLECHSGCRVENRLKKQQPQ